LCACAGGICNLLLILQLVGASNPCPERCTVHLCHSQTEPRTVPGRFDPAVGAWFHLPVFGGWLAAGGQPAVGFCCIRFLCGFSMDCCGEIGAGGCSAPVP